MVHVPLARAVGGGRLPPAAVEGSGLLDAANAVPLWAWQLLVLGGAGASIAVVYRMAPHSDEWTDRLRSRLLFGVPWGTLLSMGVVLSVYLFLQGGLGHLHDPVTYAFQATAYEYPLGVVTSSFAHKGFGHLFGNLAGTLVFGAIAEYGFGHFPRGREEAASDVRELRRNAVVRILAFVGAVVLAGLAFGVFAWGPVIGFSGVVYALAGVALLVRPLPAVVGILAVESRLPSLLYNAVMNPFSTVRPVPSSGNVWFADVAVQGHLFGFLLGVLVGAVLLQRRDELPRPSRVWFAALVFGASQGLWVAYWYLGNEQYVLFRGGGLAFVFVLSTLVLVAVAGSRERLLPAVTVRGRSFARRGPSRWTAATSVLLVLLVAMAAVGATVNLATIQDPTVPNDPVDVRDYEVGYTENVTNRQLAVLDLPGLEGITNVRASGVVVASDKRNIWQVAASTHRLAFRGYARVLVGGVGWRAEIWATRTGWSVVGGSSTYRVRLHPPDATARTVYTSGPATSAVRIANRSISLRTTPDGFEIVVRRNESTLGTGPLPSTGGNVTVGDIRFQRVDNRLYATYRGTIVQVAKKQEPGVAEFRE